MTKGLFFCIKENDAKPPDTVSQQLGRVVALAFDRFMMRITSVSYYMVHRLAWWCFCFVVMYTGKSPEGPLADTVHDVNHDCFFLYFLSSLEL
jgi:hypothetical protein